MAAVEGGILPPRMATLSAEMTVEAVGNSAGRDARLCGRRDARGHGKQLPGFSPVCCHKSPV